MSGKNTSIPVLTRFRFLWGIFTCLCGLTSCSDAGSPRVSIAVNPWPGYSFLYLAESEGYFARHGLDVKIVSVDSLSDAKRALVHGRVDGMASTLVESTYAQLVSDQEISTLLVSGYSKGADVILARKEIGSVAQLKGKRVGCEVGALGQYLLYRALENNELSLSDVNIVHTKQVHSQQQFGQGLLDAYVRYLPLTEASVDSKPFHSIFTTSEIPIEIVDTIVIQKEQVEQNPSLPTKFLRAWRDAIDHYKARPEASSIFLAQRLGISVDEFKSALGQLTITDGASEQRLLEDQRLNVSAKKICQMFSQTGAISSDCNQISTYSIL